MTGAKREPRAVIFRALISRIEKYVARGRLNDTPMAASVTTMPERLWPLSAAERSFGP